jgi:hypothetical protein
LINDKLYYYNYYVNSINKMKLENILLIIIFSLICLAAIIMTCSFLLIDCKKNASHNGSKVLPIENIENNDDKIV